MPTLPTVQKNGVNVSGGQVNITESTPSPMAQLGEFVATASQDYFIEEKRQFDKIRLIEAQNMMEAHKSRLEIDEEEGFSNKRGEQAIMFKDDEGRDLVTSYSDKYRKAADETISQLRLTADQQSAFKQMVEKDSLNWTEGLRRHQVKESMKYKESVLVNTMEIATRKAMGSFQDIGAMNESLETINVSIREMGKQFGWSQAEVTNKLAEQFATVHDANVKTILDGGDFELAEEYLGEYESQIPEINRFGFQNKINDLKTEAATQELINNIQMGAMEGSNPAFNTSDPVLLEELAGAEYDSDGFKIRDKDESGVTGLGGGEGTGRGRKADTRPIGRNEHRNLRYNDPRLDAKTEVIGRQLGMDWAKPLVTALRLAGEKSNNNQVSPAGARGVMQFMPIAIEQVRRITGKKIDPLDPDQSLWAAYKFVDWISKKYGGTKDHRIIASFYNGGGRYVGHLKSGGANAIPNKENRNYVNRIDSFLRGGAYQKHLNKPIIGDQLDPRLIQNLPVKQQAQVLNAHKAVVKQKEAAAKKAAENFYESAIDAVTRGRLTDIRQLDAQALGTLNAKQQQAIKAVIKADQLGEYDPKVYLSYVTNPSAVMRMSNADFKGFLMQIPPNKREEVAKDYAKLAGRSVADVVAIRKEERSDARAAVKASAKAQADAQKEAAKGGGGTPKNSIVHPTLVAKTLSRNAAAYGFNTAAKAGTNKKGPKMDAKGSAFWVKTIDDITDRIRESEQRNGKFYNAAQIDSVVTAYLDNAKIKQGGQVKGGLYNPKTFKREDVLPMVNDFIIRKSGGGYNTVDDIPDNLFMKYYFQYYRGKGRN